MSIITNKAAGDVVFIAKPIINSKKFISAGRGLGEGFLNAVKDAIQEIFHQKGQKLGDADAFFETLMKKVSGTLNSGIEQIDLTESATTLGSKFRKAINVAGTGAADGFGDVTSLLSQKVTMSVLPYLVASLALAVGTPLTAHYLYKKAVQNLGKPKLLGEVYRANPIERLRDHVQSGLNQGLQIVGSGLKWGAITAGLGMGSMLPALVIGEYRSIGVPPEKRPAYLDHPENYLQTIGEVSGVVAGSTIVYQLVTELLSSLKKYLNEGVDPKPIVNDKTVLVVEEIIESARNIKKNGGFFQKVLFYGPGGTGKTMLAKWIAKEAEMDFIPLSGGALPECIKRGDHITELKKLFGSITKPTVVFFDEMESIAKKRDLMQRSEELELINELFHQTGTDSRLILLMGATNKPEMIDPDMLSRFNRKLFIAPPGHDERIRILDEHIPYFFTQKERETQLNPLVVNTMAEYTDGLTGRALFKMINSIYAKKMMSSDHILRPEMISSTMEQFVEQERELEKWQTESFYTKMPKASAVSNPSLFTRTGMGNFLKKAPVRVQ